MMTAPYQHANTVTTISVCVQELNQRVSMLEAMVAELTTGADVEDDPDLTATDALAEATQAVETESKPHPEKGKSKAA